MQAMTIIPILTMLFTLIEVAAFYYLYWSNRDLFLKEWTFAWLLYALRFLALSIEETSYFSIYVHLIQDAFSLFSAYYLLRASLVMSKKNIPPYLFFLPIVLVIFSTVTHTYSSNLHFQHAFTHLFVGAVFIYMGIKAIQNARYSHLLRWVFGVSIILWGIQKWSDPLCISYSDARMIGFSVSFCLSLLVVLSFLLIYYQRRWDSLEKTKSYSQQLFELTPIGLVLCDNRGIFIDVNRSFCQMVGRDKEELQSMSFDQITPESYREEDIRLFNELKISGKLNPFRKHYVKKEGGLIPVEINGISLNIEDSEGYLCTIKDLTAALEYEQKLRDKAEEAKQAAIAKTNFMASISHELRTPLHSICGIAEIISKRLAAPDDRSLMENLIRNSNILIALINDVLDITRTEDDQITFEMLPIDLEEIVEEVTTLLSGQLKEKLNTLEVKIENEAKQLWLGDPTRLKQILFNLLGNSIKFTAHGTINLIISAREEFVEFKIIDSGIGISPSMLDKIFDHFTQADTSITRRFGGSGMGLTISKLLIEKMGGTIKVESIEGKGAIFTFSVNLKVIEDNEVVEKKASPSHHQIPPCKILLVDDAPDNLVLLELFLRESPVEIDKATNGKMALDMMIEKNYGLVIMDIQMPVMDGITAVQNYRKWEVDNRDSNDQVPIIALTADTLTIDHQRCLRIGFSDHIVKPIKQKELIQHILTILSSQK